MWKPVTIIIFAVSASACASKIYDIELHAADSFRGNGETYWIGEFDPWTRKRAEGCIHPGEIVRVRVRLSGAALMVSVPRSTLTIAPRGNGAPETVFLEVRPEIEGTGAPEAPFIVRFVSLARWRAFVDSWARYDEERQTLSRSKRNFMEFEADEARLRAIASTSEIEALFDERPDLRVNYHAWLDDFAGAARRPDLCAAGA